MRAKRGTHNFLPFFLSFFHACMHGSIHASTVQSRACMHASIHTPCGGRAVLWAGRHTESQRHTIASYVPRSIRATTTSGRPEVVGTWRHMTAPPIAIYPHSVTTTQQATCARDDRCPHGPMHARAARPPPRLDRARARSAAPPERAVQGRSGRISGPVFYDLSPHAGRANKCAPPPSLTTHAWPWLVCCRCSCSCNCQLQPSSLTPMRIKQMGCHDCRST